MAYEVDDNVPEFDEQLNFVLDELRISMICLFDDGERGRIELGPYGALVVTIKGRNFSGSGYNGQCKCRDENGDIVVFNVIMGTLEPIQ